MLPLELKISSLCKIQVIVNMHKKFIKVTIERHDVTEDVVFPKVILIREVED